MTMRRMLVMVGGAVLPIALISILFDNQWVVDAIIESDFDYDDGVGPLVSWLQFPRWRLTPGHFDWKYVAAVDVSTVLFFVLLIGLAAAGARVIEPNRGAIGAAVTGWWATVVAGGVAGFVLGGLLKWAIDAPVRGASVWFTAGAGASFGFAFGWLAGLGMLGGFFITRTRAPGQQPYGAQPYGAQQPYGRQPYAPQQPGAQMPQQQMPQQQMPQQQMPQQQMPQQPMQQMPHQQMPQQQAPQQPMQPHPSAVPYVPPPGQPQQPAWGGPAVPQQPVPQQFGAPPVPPQQPAQPAQPAAQPAQPAPQAQPQAPEPEPEPAADEAEPAEPEAKPEPEPEAPEDTPGNADNDLDLADRTVIDRKRDD